MKRHPSLAHLSRDHHPALILAQLLKRTAPDYKGLPHSTAGKLEYALRFYDKDLVGHFEREEEMMNILTGIDPELDEKMRQIKAEHVLIHSLFSSLSTEEDAASALGTLGHTLEAHIRSEERELFPLIENCCDENKLLAIEKILTSRMS